MRPLARVACTTSARHIGRSTAVGTLAACRTAWRNSLQAMRQAEFAIRREQRGKPGRPIRAIFQIATSACRRGRASAEPSKSQSMNVAVHLS